MPSTGVKTPPPGFLREINFSALANAHIRRLFGDVVQPAWMKFTIWSTREVAELQTVFSLRIEANPQPTVSFATSGLRVRGVPSFRPRDFTVEFRVPDTVLMEFREELPDMFGKWLTQAIKEKAHKLYEFDPRIGWQWKQTGDELPASPLFDPPGGCSRTGLPERDEEDPTRVSYSRCPFCREVHEGDAPIWGGANLRWVHPHCWRGS